MGRDIVQMIWLVLPTVILTTEGKFDSEDIFFQQLFVALNRNVKYNFNFCFRNDQRTDLHIKYTESRCWRRYHPAIQML